MPKKPKLPIPHQLSKIPAGEYSLSGRLEIDDDGGFFVTLEGSPAGTEPEPPDPEPPELPEGAAIISPSGGDDTQLLRDAVGQLPEGGALVLKGMFRVSDTIKLEGGRNRTVCGCPGERSGILVESADMPGMYGAMLHLRNAEGSVFRDLEIDAQGHSTCPIEVDGGSDNEIARVHIHDIGFSGGSDPTLAAIHSESGTRLHVHHNRIERTGGNRDKDEGIRGIWLGKGQVDPLVEDNEVSDTGHTCIAVEPCSGIIRRNKAYRSMTQGSLYKIIRHPQASYAAKVEFYENYGEESRHAGLMLETADFELVDVHHNHFVGCGEQGTTFGFLYTSGSTTRNARVHDNVVENCRSFGAMNRSDSCVIENNTISGENTLWLEFDDTNITVNNSGRVNVGADCSNIVVDGQQVA
jgi:hypothetical protein